MSVACDTYTKLMSQLGYGYPLWEPEPTSSDGVLVADVGYIHNGGFYRLFNTTFPAMEEPAEDGMPREPEGYTPLVIPQHLRWYKERALDAGPICSRSVTAFQVDAGV